jgi:NAD(P)H-dependent FMN reductase
MGDGQTIRVLGVSGSLRRGSYDSAALRAAMELASALGPELGSEGGAQ